MILRFIPFILDQVSSYLTHFQSLRLHPFLYLPYFMSDNTCTNIFYNFLIFFFENPNLMVKVGFPILSDTKNAINDTFSVTAPILFQLCYEFSI